MHLTNDLDLMVGLMSSFLLRLKVDETALVNFIFYLEGKISFSFHVQGRIGMSLTTS